jgi:ubiquinone/menaquinone biosynthesis C-methylase UbiE
MEKPAVAMTMAADTRRAFDSVADEYDRSNSSNRLLCEMRRRTLAAVVRHAPPGARVLDLGCGPGADAETLAAAGYSVTAIDASGRMVDEARGRIERAGLQGHVTVRHLGIDELDELPTDVVDAAYSNFGPLNCVADLSRAADLIARRLRHNGVLIASVIGRVCPWEIGLYLAKGDFARAGVRFARQSVAVPLNGHTVWTRYYTPGEFQRAFAGAGFHPVSLRALGLFAPPPYLQAFAERHRGLIGALQRADDLAGGWPLLRSAGDHFLIVLQKRGSLD